MVNGRWVFVIMKGGDENGEGVNMVNTNAELILQHSRSLITHADKHFLPSLLVSSIHFIVDEVTENGHQHDPEHQKFWKPSPVGLNKCVASFGTHLLVQPHRHWVVALHLQTHQEGFFLCFSPSPFFPLQARTRKSPSFRTTFSAVETKGHSKLGVNYHYSIVFRDSNISQKQEWETKSPSLYTDISTFPRNVEISTNTTKGTQPIPPFLSLLSPKLPPQISTPDREKRTQNSRRKISLTT